MQKFFLVVNCVEKHFIPIFFISFAKYVMLLAYILLSYT